MTHILSPSSVGIGLRAPHYKSVLQEKPPVDFLEVHSENFFHAGGAALATLKAVRRDYPLSLHGVGLSLGSASELQAMHLDQLARLVEETSPTLVSEHLAWNHLGTTALPDLLPLPANRQTLELMTERVDAVQTRLGRQILIENISAYLRFRDAEMSDLQFLAELANRTGCGILLDINNLYVNAENHGFDARDELVRLPARHIGEIHLAGHESAGQWLIDTHGSAVCAGVWALYEFALECLGPVPTLIERDTNIPPLNVLVAEAEKVREHQLHAVELAHV